ncbi:MAG: hypothetical protein WAV90_15815 [Gordonia amarae]
MNETIATFTAQAQAMLEELYTQIRADLAGGGIDVELIAECRRWSEHVAQLVAMADDRPAQKPKTRRVGTVPQTPPDPFGRR